MRTVIQRVLSASVRVEGELISECGSGLLVLLGVENGDTSAESSWLAGKLTAMRIFSDDEGKMNRSVIDLGGEIIVVSQFTLHAATKKGNRPSFLRAAPPPVSQPLYEHFCEETSRLLGKPVGRGIFGADMQIALVNDGPVTIIVDTRDSS